MKRVIIESPYAGRFSFPHGPEWLRKIIEWIGKKIDRYKNIKYARECMKDSLSRDEAPFLSHLLYPQVLNDNKIMERPQGIQAGVEWGKCADAIAVYQDRGITPGMKSSIKVYKKAGIKIEYRSIK